MVIHFVMHWPQAADTNLWSFAVDHAIYIWNRIPDGKTHFSPVDLFTSNLHFSNNDLQRLHVLDVLSTSLMPNSKTARRFRNGHVTVVVVSIWALASCILPPFTSF